MNTPKALCDSRREDIARLVDILGMELAKLPAPTWGMAGTLGMVRSMLVEAVASISGVEMDRIEEMLVDAYDAEQDARVMAMLAEAGDAGKAVQS